MGNPVAQNAFCTSQRRWQEELAVISMRWGLDVGVRGSVLTSHPLMQWSSSGWGYHFSPMVHTMLCGAKTENSVSVFQPAVPQSDQQVNSGNVYRPLHHRQPTAVRPQTIRHRRVSRGQTNRLTSPSRSPSPTP